MLLYVVLLLPVYYIGISYNDGDNQVNNLIISRLMPDKEKGFSGNNRVSEDFDIYFEKWSQMVVYCSVWDRFKQRKFSQMKMEFMELAISAIVSLMGPFLLYFFSSFISIWDLEGI